MKYFFYTLLIVTGAALVKAYAVLYPDPIVDPIMVIKDQVKTQAIIEHEVTVTTSYEFCPDTFGPNHKLFIMYPMKLNYELSLNDMEISLNNKVITVNAPEIQTDDPTVYNDKMRAHKLKRGLSLADRDALINTEISKSTMVGEYLTQYFLHNDQKIEDDVKKEVANLVGNMASVLKVDFNTIEVNIKSQEPIELKLNTGLELCDSNSVQANGVVLKAIKMAVE